MMHNTHSQSPGGCNKEMTKSGIIDWENYHFGADNSGKYYQWDMFRARDDRTMRRMEESGVAVIDVRMLYQRTDAHVGSHSGDDPEVRGVSVHDMLAMPISTRCAAGCAV